MFLYFDNYQFIETIARVKPACRITRSGRDTKPLHRIEPSVVRSEVEAAGFVFDGESRVLANPADDHALRVFDAAIRGHTDQFAYRFRKPAGRGYRRAHAARWRLPKS